MLNELEPVWRHLAETYEALESILDEIPDARLDWQPGAQAKTPSAIVQHIARANITYANVMQTGETGVRPEILPNLPRTMLLERIHSSLERVRATFEALPLDRLHAPCADDWAPLGPPIPGPLDALWFAHVMVVHTAYHVGQLSYFTSLGDGG